MDSVFLESLGLKVTEVDGVIEAMLELTSGLAMNPLTRQVIGSVSFTVMGDRLLYVGPPEFVGAQPIRIPLLSTQTRLEDIVVETLNEHLYQLERRSSELSALGINPKVDPSTLQLGALLERGGFTFLLGASRTGQFRIIECRFEGREVPMGAPAPFELSEFRDRSALEDFLYAMFAEGSGSGGSAERATPVGVPEFDASLTMKALYEAFGDASVPPRSVMEFFCELVAGDTTVRFAAARLSGRTFRGLLAGPKGKIWADRFELDEFPGIRALVSELLGIPIEQIEVVE
jgi:hypothetical protein